MKRTIANILRSLASRLDPPHEQGWIYALHDQRSYGASASCSLVHITAWTPL